MTTKPKTILFDLCPLDTQSRGRGIGRYVRDLAIGLSRIPASSRSDLRIIGLTRVGWTGGYRITEDLEAFNGNSDVPHPGTWDKYRFTYSRRLALWAVARRLGADAIHLGDPNATPLLMGLSGCKSIVTCHDLIPSRFPDRYFSILDGGAAIGQMIQCRRYRSADLVVAISDSTLEDVVHFAGVPRERVVRVYNGVDLSRWTASGAMGESAILQRHGLADNAYMLYVGDGDWRKNPDGMIAGIAKARERGIDVKLAWAGTLSQKRAATVDHLAREAGISAHVLRLGYVPDEELGVLFRRARGHLFVSRCEGFGLTVVEAMASGCPVITTREGSLAEVAGQASLTVEPEDHEAIGEAIVRLCRDNGLRTELAKRGRARALQFSIGAQAQAMLQVYRRVVGGG